MSGVESLRLYCRLMEEIKARQKAIRLIVGRSVTLCTKFNIESIYLQIRKILELIALGSLVANKKKYSEIHEKFQSHYNAKLIINDIEKINPKFYPRPIAIRKSDEPGVKDNWDDLRDNYLTKINFIKLYERCGSLMHSENPYGKSKNIDYYRNNVDISLKKITTLLNKHIVYLLDSKIYLIQMGIWDAPVTGYIFEKIDHINKNS